MENEIEGKFRAGRHIVENLGIPGHGEVIHFMRALGNAVPFFSGNFPMKTPSRIYDICSLISAYLVNTAVPNTSRSTLLAKQAQYRNTSGTRTY